MPRFSVGPFRRLNRTGQSVAPGACGGALFALVNGVVPFRRRPRTWYPGTVLPFLPLFREPGVGCGTINEVSRILP